MWIRELHGFLTSTKENQTGFNDSPSILGVRKELGFGLVVFIVSRFVPQKRQFNFLASTSEHLIKTYCSKCDQTELWCFSVILSCAFNLVFLSLFT